MPERPSFQERLAELSEQIFVGREKELALFEAHIQSAEPPFLVLAVSGPPGVGKTTLLRQFRRRARELGAVTALASEDDAGVPETLAKLARELEASDVSLAGFRTRYERYRELLDGIRSDPDAPSDLLASSVQGVAQVALRSLNLVPGVREARDVLDTGEVEERLARDAGHLVAYLRDRFKSRHDQLLLLDAERQLSRSFVSDLNEHTERIVLMLDSYQTTRDQLERWLLRLTSDGEYGEFGTNVSFVIAGQSPLGNLWSGGGIRRLSLPEFTEVEARLFLKQEGITGEGRVAELIRLSGGLPILLAMATSRPESEPFEVSGDAIDALLAGRSREEREVCLSASVPRFFNRDVLRVVLRPRAEEAFEVLTASSFVELRSQGWAYHGVIRALMIRYLRLRSETECRMLHAALEEHHRSVPPGGRIGAVPRNQLETWYHRLSQLEPAELEPALAELAKALSGEDESAVRAYGRMLAQVSSECDDPTLDTWERAIADLGNPTLAEVFGHEMRVTSILERIRFHLMQKQLDEAEKLFELAAQAHADTTALEPLRRRLEELRDAAFQAHVKRVKELLASLDLEQALERIDRVEADLPRRAEAKLAELGRLRALHQAAESVAESLELGDLDEAATTLNDAARAYGEYEVLHGLRRRLDNHGTARDWPRPLDGPGVWHPGSWLLPGTSVSVASMLALALGSVLLLQADRPALLLSGRAPAVGGLVGMLLALAITRAGRYRPGSMLTRTWPLAVALICARVRHCCSSARPMGCRVLSSSR